MKERIKEIMDKENLTPSLFADRLNIGRAVVSHILNGRNNPSLDVVTRILDTFDNINADWLLSGKGQMLKDADGNHATSMPLEPIRPVSTVPHDLFSTAINNDTIGDIPKNIIKPTAVEPPKTDEPGMSDNSANKEYTYVNKSISKVIIYYNDSTFQAFNPDMKPL